VTEQFRQHTANYNMSFGVQAIDSLLRLLFCLRPLRPSILASPAYQAYLARHQITEEDMQRVLTQLYTMVNKSLAFMSSLLKEEFLREDPRSKHYTEYLKNNERITLFTATLMLHEQLHLFVKDTSLERVTPASYQYEIARKASLQELVNVEQGQRYRQEQEEDEAQHAERDHYRQ
jgi:hypothetical protein